MIKNLTLTLLVVFGTINLSYTQPPSSCIESEEMAFCDLDDVNGAMFTNPAPGTVDVPTGPLCGGGAFHNPGWFSFVAGSQDIQLTVTPMNCDTIPPNDLTGVQVALWQGCPEGDGVCVAGDAACNDTPVTLNASGLIVGEIYNITIDGCAGSVCTVTVSIDASQPFDIPDVDDVDFAEPEYNVRGGCDSGLDDGIFCAGLEVLFSIADDVYETLGAEWTWTIDGISGAADPSTVEWSSGSFNGTGSPVNIGDLDGDLGANIVNMSFTEPGVYEICLTQVVSECETTDGENCIEVTIITPGLQDFGEYKVCVLDLVAGWEPPDEDANGNVWGGGTFNLQDVLSAPDGVIELSVNDDCDCEFTQRVKIIPVGSLDREDIELFLLPCQLPYQWFDFEIDNFLDYASGVDEVLTEGSSHSDYDGERCDSLINLTVVELELIDSILVGECTPSGTEFTLILILLDNEGEEIDILNPTFEWIDSVTNLVVGTGQTIFLETGTYYVNVTSLVQDLNYSDLSGTDTESPCNFLFGPYDLEGGSSQDAAIMAYDTTLCSDQLDNVIFVIDTIPNTTYTWIVPAGIPFTISPGGDSLTANWTNAMPGDTIMVVAENDCGVSDPIDLPLEIVVSDLPTVNADAEECIDNEFMVTFSGDAANIASYDWDFGTGMITSGSNNSPGPIGVTFPLSGMYTYTLTVIDIGGCESSESFDVDISDPIEAPVITCMPTPNQIIFEWTDTGADDYSVTVIAIPGGATGASTGFTSYTVTGLNPNETVTIEVVAEGSGPCGNTTFQFDCTSSNCDLSGVVPVNFNDMDFCQNHPDNTTIQFEHTLPPGITGSYIGNGIIDANLGIFDPNDPSLLLGVNTIAFNFMDASCQDLEEITITIYEQPDATFNSSASTVCQNEVFTLENFSNNPNGVFDYGAGATGDFSGLSYSDAGTKDISFVIVDPVSLCGDSLTVQVEVLQNIIAPVVLCTPAVDQVNFDWADIVGASSYDIEVLVNSVPFFTGNQANSDFLVSPLLQGDQVDISVTVAADNGCGMFTVTAMCEAQTCLVPDIQMSSVQNMFCTNGNLAPVSIDIMVDGSLPDNGIVQGSGIADQDVYEFDPLLAGIGMHTVTYSYTSPIDNCITSETIDFEVVQPPTPSFNLDNSTICIDETATVTTITLPPDVNESWVFNTLNSTPISPTEYLISYDSPGDFDITLNYSITGCPPIEAMQTITVIDTITFPTISCMDAGTEFIEFDWNDQANVDEYEIYIDNVFDSNQNNSDFRLENLAPATSYTLTVIAIDNECGSREISIDCETPDCVIPDIELTVPQNTFCTNDNLSSVNIDVLVDGDPPANGTFVGAGIVDPNVNQFDPMLAGVGMHTVTFSYINPFDNCLSTETVDFEIIDPPVPSFNIDNSTICIDEFATVTTTSLPPNVNEAWLFNTLNSTAISPNEYQVSYDSPGEFDVTLNYSITGCPPIEALQTITVIDTITFPSLRCEDSGTDYIEFGWNDQTNVDDYEIYVDGVFNSNQSNSDFLLNNLEPATTYTLTVIAIDNECGSREISIDCVTPTCVPPSIVNNIPMVQCYDPGSGAIELDVQVTSMTGTQGSYTWDSPMVDANDMFTPSSGDQTYSFNLIYTEGNCETLEPISFTINEFPQNTLDLSVDQQVICINSSIMVTAENASITDETADWDFGNTSIVNASGSGFGPYELTFTQSGSYPINLTVDNAGCESPQEGVTIIVEDELIPPTVNCGNTGVFELDFSWNTVDCASEYNIFVDGSLAATIQGTSYMLDGLNELQSVDITVEAVTECACASVMSQEISCSTVACPSTSFDVSNFENPICLDVNASSFNITANPVDLQGNGSGIWSGGPVANGSGLIDPSLVTSGTYQLSYDYDEAGCSYNYTTDITFVEAPSITILEEMDPNCITDNFGYINVAGTGGLSSYMYSLDQGSLQASGEFASVSPGIHSIEIEDANGCVNSTTVEITSAINPTASIQGPSTVILDNDGTFTLVTNAPNINDIIWTSNGNVVCQGPSCISYTMVSANADATLEVQIIFNGTCVVNASFFVDVKEIQAFYVPNIISPNTNNSNSSWKIFMKGSETFFRSIKVYNRWGNLVHDFTNPDPGFLSDIELWDGYVDDRPAVTEVYVYVLELEIEEIPRIITGNLTIVR